MAISRDHIYLTFKRGGLLKLAYGYIRGYDAIYNYDEFLDFYCT